VPSAWRAEEQSDDRVQAEEHAVSPHAHFEMHVKKEAHLPPERSPEVYPDPYASPACELQCCSLHDVQASLVGGAILLQAKLVLLFEELLLQAMMTTEMVAAESSEKTLDRGIGDPPGRWGEKECGMTTSCAWTSAGDPYSADSERIAPDQARLGTNRPRTTPARRPCPGPCARSRGRMREAKLLVRVPFPIAGDGGTESMWIERTAYDARTVTGKLSMIPSAPPSGAEGTLSRTAERRRRRHIEVDQVPLPTVHCCMTSAVYIGM
jgi:hypothetical protein